MRSRVNTTVMIFLAGNFEFDLDRGGKFVVRGQELPTAYVRAKFEDRSFTRLRNIVGGAKISKLGHWMCCGMRSQFRLISASDTWSERSKPKISRAAALNVDRLEDRLQTP